VNIVTEAASNCIRYWDISMAACQYGYPQHSVLPNHTTCVVGAKESISEATVRATGFPILMRSLLWARPRNTKAEKILTA